MAEYAGGVFYNDVLLGQLYLGKLNADSAILCFEKSKKSDNLYTSVTSYLGLGEAYELKGKYDMSIKYYKKQCFIKIHWNKMKRE